MCLLAFIATSVCVFLHSWHWTGGGPTATLATDAVFLLWFSQITAMRLERNLDQGFDNIYVPFVLAVPGGNLGADGGGSHLKVSVSNMVLQIRHVRYCKPSVPLCECCGVCEFERRSLADQNMQTGKRDYSLLCIPVSLLFLSPACCCDSVMTFI